MLAVELLERLEIRLGVVHVSYSPAYRNIGLSLTAISPFTCVHDTILIYGNLLSLQEDSHHPMRCFP